MQKNTIVIFWIILFSNLHTDLKRSNFDHLAEKFTLKSNHFLLIKGSNSHVLKITASQRDYALLDMNNLKTIRIFGVSGMVKSITVNGVNHSKYEHDTNTKELIISELAIKLDLATPTDVKINL